MRRALLPMSAALLVSFGPAACGDGDASAPAADVLVADTAPVDAVTADTTADSDAAISDTPCAVTTGPDGAPVSCIAGRLVDRDGAPVVGVKVSACTLTTCIIGQSVADGRYTVTKLPVEPHKVEILGEVKGYATFVFHQPTRAGVLSTAPWDIVLPLKTDDATPWLPAEGGTASLLDGAIAVTAAPGALRYPLGTVDKAISVLAVAPEDLPPYDLTPWVGHEPESLAFYFGPFPILSDAPLGLEVRGPAGVADGARYDVYAAHHLTARLERVGGATADAAGVLTLDADAALMTLSTLVLVPRD